MIAFLIAAVYGIRESYDVHREAVTTSLHISLYFTAWITAILSSLSNLMLLVFCLIAFFQSRRCAIETPELCPDLESNNKKRYREPTTTTKPRSMPKSRSAIRNAR